MDLGGKTLRDWLATAPKEKFPGGGAPDYWKRFQAIEDYLNTHVHKFVNAGAMIGDGGCLTDHGPDHIRTVIQRASEMARAERFTLEPYEVYLFLVAAHVHDVGNIFERNAHELRAEDVWAKLGSLMGEERPELKAIDAIAAAHGGSIEGDKDKIGRLLTEDFVMGITIRPRVIAALLRFADELADDRSRAARILLELDKVPPSSQVYHQYAHALHSVIVRVPGDSLELRFDMTREGGSEKYGKGRRRVYLLDEIFERTLKMHTEQMYCMRFLRPDISIDKIGVKIEIFGPRYSGSPVVISYNLKESGYPELVGQTIHSLCPELCGHKVGRKVSGKVLQRFLEKEGS